MIIYKITNKENGKVYIGQTSRSLQERMSEHYRNDTTIIDRALKKYGKDGFNVEVVDTAASYDELNKKEQEWIKKCDCMVPNGYNLTIGGNVTNGYHHTDEAKKKMSEAKKGKKTGAENPFYGKTHSKETCERWSKQRRGRKLSAEWRKNISKGEQKKVINTDTGVIYDSLKEAAAHYGIDPTHITRVCKGKNKTSAGCHWAYFNGDYVAYDNTVPSQLCWKV